MTSSVIADRGILFVGDEPGIFSPNGDAAIDTVLNSGGTAIAFGIDEDAGSVSETSGGELVESGVVSGDTQTTVHGPRARPSA